MLYLSPSTYLVLKILHVLVCENTWHNEMYKNVIGYRKKLIPAIMAYNLLYPVIRSYLILVLP